MELGDVEFLGRSMNITLTTAERHRGNSALCEPIGIQAPVGDGQLGLVPFRFYRRGGSDDAWLVPRQPKRFIIEPTIDLEVAAAAGRVANGVGRPLKCRVNL